jgi:hypothetical protein
VRCFNEGYLNLSLQFLEMKGTVTLIMWPESLNSSPSKDEPRNILKKYFSSISNLLEHLMMDSDIYFVFNHNCTTESNGISFSIWEYYTVPRLDEPIIQNVKPSQILRKTIRRTNLHKASVIAIAAVRARICRVIIYKSTFGFSNCWNTLSTISRSLGRC